MVKEPPAAPDSARLNGRCPLIPALDLVDRTIPGATILVDMVNHRLPDFERFRDELLAYVREQETD